VAKTLREFALEAWSQEQQKQKQADLKKRKRKAKKIEEEIEELLPRDSEDLQFERNLEEPGYEVVVSISDSEGALRFTRDESDDLTIVGQCPRCKRVCLSKPITRLEELGLLIESFEPGLSHTCTSSQ